MACAAGRIGISTPSAPMSASSLVFVVCQIPERSGLPSAVRGAGAERFGRPSGKRGIPGVGYLIHCADTAFETARTNAPIAMMRDMLWLFFVIFVPVVAELRVLRG